jgi:hypothetical protein
MAETKVSHRTLALIVPAASPVAVLIVSQTLNTTATAPEVVGHPKELHARLSSMDPAGTATTKVTAPLNVENVKPPSTPVTPTLF